MSQSREAELIYWVIECVWSVREDVGRLSLIGISVKCWV